jgi:hypothetical protein
MPRHPKDVASRFHQMTCKNYKPPARFGRHRSYDIIAMALAQSV